MHSVIARYLVDRQWERAHQKAIEEAASIRGDGYQPDGLKVVAGESWIKPFEEPDFAEEA